MNSHDQVYIDLQQHLDRQAVGFPASKSRAELKILRHIFTPREAAIATFLDYRHEPLEAIHPRVTHLVETAEELASVLDGILNKGGIEAAEINGRTCYANTPLVVGMYELQVDRLTPEFISDFKTYTSDWRFGLEFLATELPQMRTIPISRSIRPRHQVARCDQAAALLEQTEGPFVVLDCICRKKQRLTGGSCRLTDRRETCLGMGPIAQTVLKGGIGREIRRQEALAIIDANQKEGLILQPSNTAKADFICSCCGCCCGMLQIHHNLPRPVDFWATNFYARIDSADCNGCGLCTRRCQARAIAVHDDRQPVRVDRNRCLGCGHCIAVCPQKAIALQKKPAERHPPETRAALFEVLKANRKSRLGKAKLAGKLALDMIRTGHLDLLR
ncbi:MAG: 4Fe-4S dicluster domain-containing protein [Desulfobacterales bacterium]|nr:4Fe-4S dicluster domain-containing protein [Desulfobacterales bacterium]